MTPAEMVAEASDFFATEDRVMVARMDCCAAVSLDTLVEALEALRDVERSLSSDWLDAINAHHGAMTPDDIPAFAEDAPSIPWAVSWDAERVLVIPEMDLWRMRVVSAYAGASER